MTKKIPLANGGFALIDIEDFEEISKYRWRRDKDGYATRVETVNRVGGKWRGKTIFMHRQIMNYPPNQDVDHENRKPLDNRRSNLRIATRSQNNMNSKVRRNNTSGYKGVNWHTQVNKWRAYITKHGKQYHLGLFENAEDAAEARRLKEIELYGEFSNG